MAKIPSIALIPSGYKATKVYSVLPTDGSADLTFNRGTSDDQTRVNSNGLIENVDQDVPRLDYLDGGCPSLLLEPATTNLYDYSEDLSSWGSLIGLSVLSDSAISPNGGLNADLLTEDTSTGAHTIRKLVGPTITATNDYSLSFFVKSNGRDIVALSNDAGSASANAFFNLTSGTILSSTFDSASMEDYGNDWWRVEATLEATGTGDYNTRIYTSIADGSFSHTGDGVSGLYIWGLQLEEQSYATSYVPSLAATNGVRDAETASKTGLSSYINSTEGVLYAEIRALANNVGGREFSLSDGTASNRLVIQYSGSSNNLVALLTLGGSSQFIFSTSLINQSEFIKVALKYKENDFALWVNGLMAEIDTSGSTFTSGTLSRLAFDNSIGGDVFYSKTKELRVYKEALSDLELARLTGFTSFASMRDYLSYEAE
jgi:hypothetical protein